jgi:hypothetical protein
MSLSGFADTVRIQHLGESMNDHVAYETVCPNNHNQTLKFTREVFDAALKSDTLVFHCNTCDTDWTPSNTDIGKLREYFSK